ncbi:transmembrane protein 245-like isoform X2 [Palaemon carinicauda]|uniref:transmembrane protein 245-like isoform X2 n=1 Tax=Palaemon carinicauda TaxID=392227 RepID=UPI0035B6667D
MAMYGDSVRSPLEQVWRQFVPQGYDQALRNAFYNVAAVVFVVCVAAAAWSVYMIFQPFVKPLLWAVLCGSLLHPAKHIVTSWTRGWLLEVHSAGSLLSMSIALLPLRLLDTISEVVGRFVVRHVRSVITVTVILPLVYIIIHHTPIFLSSLAYTVISTLFHFIATIVSIASSNGYIVLTFVLGYVIAVVFFWSSNTSRTLSKMSLAVWVIAAAGISGLWPAGSVPIFIIMCLLLVAGLFTEILDFHALQKASRGDEVTLIESALLVCLGNSTEIEAISTPCDQDDESSEKCPSTLSPVKEEDSIEELNHQNSDPLSTIPEISNASSLPESSEEKPIVKVTNEDDDKTGSPEMERGERETKVKATTPVSHMHRTFLDESLCFVSSCKLGVDNSRRRRLTPWSNQHSCLSGNHLFYTPQFQRICGGYASSSTPRRHPTYVSCSGKLGVGCLRGERATCPRTESVSKDGNTSKYLRGVSGLAKDSNVTVWSCADMLSPCQSDSFSTPATNTPRPHVLLSASATPRTLSSHPCHNSGSSSVDDDDSSSNMYLKGVFVACVLVELWQHNYLLPLLPLAMLYYLIKKLASRYLSWGVKSGSAVSSAASSACDSLVTWADVRRSALFPPPIKGVVKLFVRSDHHLVLVFSSTVDAIVTLLLILAVIVFAVTASIFLAVQIQGESMALVTIGSQVINSTVVNNPQFLELLPEGLGDVVSSALDEGYLYGREWIASLLVEVEGSSRLTINATKVVRGMLGETDDAKAVLLEKQVVELWDRVYQAWVAAHPMPPARGPVVTSEAVAMTFDSIVEGLRKTPGVVSFSFISEVVRDNLGTVVSVLESVWSILLGNLSLAVSALTAATSLLLGGSLSLLNALISMVVFMSSLFYVLSASDSVYKPVAVLMNLAPGQMNHLGKAVEDAVNGVFIASLKMGAFYGMWTWLLHSLFSTNIVYIPAVLGALFGAVPLLGTYWAALPGALELCWSQGSPTLALLLLGAQLLPMSCVDTAIYADIKGGSHPYLTGLAVAGGIFYWGAEGAILGPMLLCILKVATNIYSALIQSPSDLTRRFGKFRRTPTIT